MVGRLVEQERVGRHQQDAREGHAHLPAAGELADVVVDHLGTECQAREDLARARLERVSPELVEARLDDAEAVAQRLELAGAVGVGHRVLERVKLVRDRGHLARAGHRLLGDRAPGHLADVLAEVADRDAAIDRDLAAVGLLVADDHAKERRFTGSVGPHQADLLAPEDAHRRLEKEDLASMLAADRVEADHGRDV